MEFTMRRFIVPILCALTLASAACRQAQPVQQNPPAGAAVTLPPVDGTSVLEHIKVLASDEYEGRAPGTRGEDLTVAYITDQLKKLGIKPGNTDGTYVQNVPLVGITVEQSPTLTFRKGAARQSLKWRDDYVAWTKRVVEKVSLDHSDLVFAGYGIQAPEFNWDDYKGADLKGKTMVVLVGDPPVRDPANPDALDPNVFEGKAMTYYGRWTYKYEMGAKLGAAGVLIVHETGPAGYPFTVVQGKTPEQFDLVTPEKNMGRAAVEGWITLDQARKLFAMAGQDYDALKKQALTREFKPVPLGVTASVTLPNAIRTVDSRNVVGKLEGSDPKLKDEYVVYTAHWDHFGIGIPVNGDRIYHGAQDNASGVGGVIEIARAFTKLPVPPRRSVLFLFVTAEEQGLLGSGYYAMSPIHPLAQTAAVINIDGMNLHGKTKDLEIVGLGLSELDDYMQKAAAEQGRIVKPDQEPEKGGYFRSDHFPFAKQGTPAINAGGGIDYIGKPVDYGRKVRDAYTANDYHKPSDNIKPDWDLSGAVQDLGLYLTVGYRVAEAEKMPEWKSGARWKAKRDEQLKGPASK
jgi:Zn-dependent M28 family amino/carboxypeptidase